MRYAAAVLFLLSFAACSSSIPPPAASAPDPEPSRSLLLVDGDETAGRFWHVASSSGDDCTLNEHSLGGGLSRSVPVRCGTRLVQLADSLLIVDEDERRSTAVDLASFEPRPSSLVDASGEATLEWSSNGNGITWRTPEGARDLPGGVRQARLLRSQPAVIAVVPAAAGDSIVHIGQQGELTELAHDEGLVVDSIGIEPAERELVFAGSRDSSDEVEVGLASLGGGSPKWLPSETGDEHTVTWAPRGNKITWFIESPGGLVMRTAHIPTGYQLSVPLGLSQIHAAAWEPRAEKIFLALSGVTHSESVISIAYGGEDRRTVVAPLQELDREFERLPGFPDVLVMSPERVRYGHRYPVSVAITPGGTATWNEQFAGLAAARREGGVIRLSDPSLLSDPAFLEALNGLGWADTERILTD